MKINKINLLSINSKFIHSSLAVASLAKMTEVYSEKYGVKFPEVTITERTINDSFDSLIYSVMNGADVYAFSVYIWNVAVVRRLCAFIRTANPESIIILGGPEVSYGTDFPEESYDYIISGEGERAFFALICKLCGNIVAPELGFTESGKIVSADTVNDLAEIVFPYSDENIGDFRDRIIYYESTRGCPFSCAYCLSSVCGKVRELSLKRVYSDLNFFISNNVPQVKFVDRTFNCNRKRSIAIWKYIIENSDGCDTNFHFEIGADLLSEEELEILSHARRGLIQLEAGIQSTCNDALDECCRHTDINRLFNNINRLISFGNINIHVDLIAGLPYENLEIFKKSFNDAYALNAHQLQLGFLKRLNGAPLNLLIEKHGYVFSKEPPYEIISNKYLSFSDLMFLKQIEDMVERFYNSGRFKQTAKEAEKLFNTPFEMFASLASLFREKELTFKPVSTKVLYNIMSKHLKSLGADCDRILLLDFYCSEKSDVVPSELKYLATVRDKSGRLVKDSSQRGNKKAQAKTIGSDAYIIDYSSRDAVNGSYKIAEVIENVYL